MSKLKLKSIVKKNDGSTLVATIVFSIVLGIGGLGYMHVMSNTASQEVDALNDEKAYITAESGLQLGIRWLRDSTNWVNRAAGTIHTFSENDVQCTVAISIVNDTTSITSTASKADLPYQKQLAFRVISKTARLGTFINSIDPTAGVGGGGLDNVTFDGPVHSNTPLYISSVSGGAVGVVFNDIVTVHNDTNHQNFTKNPPNTPEHHWGNYAGGSNDYTFGVWHKNSSQNSNDGALKIDDFFKADYLHSQGKRYLPDIDPATMVLPTSAGAVTDTPIVHFTGNSLTYKYYTAPGVPAVITKSPISDSVIQVNNLVGVLGTVSGRVTLKGSASNDIVVLGDLTYDPSVFTPNGDLYYDNYNNELNYGIDTTKTDVLALVSEADIFMSPVERYYDVVTNTLMDSSSVPNPTRLFLTASLIAKNTGHGVMWQTKSGNFDKPAYQYDLYAIGDRIIDIWFNYGPADKSLIRFYHDKRLDTDEVRAPGIPDVQEEVPTGADGLKILTGVWTETNIALP